MTRYAFAMIAAPLALTAVPVTMLSAQTSPPAPIQQSDLGRVNAYIRAVKTMKANFSQTDRNGQVLTGALTIKQPGKVRFQYQKGIPLLIVGDGKSLTLIDYEVGQVQRWPIGNSPLGALLDPSRDLSKYGKVVQTGDPRILMVEARDPKRPEFGTISLVFKRKPESPAGLELYGWVALDSQNNRTTIRLSGHQYGMAIADSAFGWRDPRPNAVGPRR